MSYFQRHSSKGSHHHEPENAKPAPSRFKKPQLNHKTEGNEPRQGKKEFNEMQIYNANKKRSPLKSRVQKDNSIPEHDMPSMMLEGENSM